MAESVIWLDIISHKQPMKYHKPKEVPRSAIYPRNLLILYLVLVVSHNIYALVGAYSTFTCNSLQSMLKTRLKF